MPGPSHPYVSVIIPVFNDAEPLKRCLFALNQQSYDRARFEIIVIDNGSESLASVKSVVDYSAVEIFGVELMPGSYAARNKGIELARGDILAFTDADCIPAVDWLAQGVTCLSAPSPCDMVVGHIHTFARNADRPNILELYQIITAFPQEAYLKQFKGGATANLLIRRKVVEHVGPFNPHLKSFGDLEWGHRVFSTGYKQCYAPQVQVKHPARHTWGELNRRTIRVAGGVYDHFVKPKDPWMQRNKMFARLIFDDLFPPVKLVFRTLTDARITKLRQTLGIALVMVWVRYLRAWEKIKIHFGGTSKRA